MKIKNIHIKLMIIVLLPLFLGGCLNELFEKRDRTLRVPAQLAFSHTDLIVDEGAGDVTIDVQLIARQMDTDLSASFVVDGASTASAGTHYTISTPSPVTIAANSSTAPLTVNVPDGPLTAGNNVQLILVLQDNSQAGVEASETQGTFTLTIRGS
ncbi:MAG: hypothetical protein R3211_08630 [Balneolaceae bacterium]|nr:hypothetical protein [Balneolaceae bacterium]